MAENTALTKVDYEADGQKIHLDSYTVKRYLVNGGGAVTDQEVMMFLKICESQKLNPFTRDAYLVKYGNQAASIITGKDAFMKRAESNQNYNGFKAGIIVINLNKQIENREGTFYLKSKEELVGGWARVFFKDGKESSFTTVSLDEYIGRKKDGTVNSMWSSKPATMIKKVALAQAMRDAFPSSLGQLYTQEEMDVDDLPTNKIDIDEEKRRERHIDEVPKPVQAIQKKQIFAIAGEKGLAAGNDIRALEEYALSNHISLRALTFDSANKLIELLNNYVVTVDAEYTEVAEEQPAEQQEGPQQDSVPVEENSEESPF